MVQAFSTTTTKRERDKRKRGETCAKQLNSKTNDFFDSGGYVAAVFCFRKFKNRVWFGLKQKKKREE